MDKEQLKNVYEQQSKAISEQLDFAIDARYLYGNRLSSSMSFEELKWCCCQFLKFDDLYSKCLRDKQNLEAEIANLFNDFSKIGC